jgi:class 3 adenylate cyclase
MVRERTGGSLEAGLLTGRGEKKERLIRRYLESLARLEDDAIHRDLLEELIHDYVKLERRVDSLLKNTLPPAVADEIKVKRYFPPRPFDCSILFTDLVGFTGLAERISGEDLVDLLDRIFRDFDGVVNRNGGTKIKTIGDAYMAVFGAPVPLENHAVPAIRTGLELLESLDRFRAVTGHNLAMRVGIHSGKVVAGVVGAERMQFDVFGDTVNVAARFESSGENGRVNVSHETYLRAGDRFRYAERGKIPLKNKEAMKAYFVTGISS